MAEPLNKNHQYSAELDALLDPHFVEENPNWKKTFPSRSKIFYVRGYTWFSEHVFDLKKLTLEEGGSVVGEMIEAAQSYKSWREAGLEFKEDFSFRVQVREALGLGGSPRRPQRIEKGLGTLCWCETFARKLETNGGNTELASKIYSKMRLQPAAYYITDFTDENLNKALEINPKLINVLTKAGGQLNSDVIRQMAVKVDDRGRRQRKLVTRKLANAVFSAFEESSLEFEELGKIDIGYVTSKYDPSQNAEASTREHIDFSQDLDY